MIAPGGFHCFHQCSISLLSSTGGFTTHGQLTLMQIKPQYIFILKNMCPNKRVLGSRIFIMFCWLLICSYSYYSHIEQNINIFSHMQVKNGWSLCRLFFIRIIGHWPPTRLPVFLSLMSWHLRHLASVSLKYFLP